MTERLLLDAMLGTLTTYLRMCGYDAASVLDDDREAFDATPDEEILTRATEENRRLLTRDRALAERADDALLVESKVIGDQLAELSAAGFELSLPETPIRCSNCNGRLVAVHADEQTPEYAPDPAERSVWRCTKCGQHFWKGSHWDDVADRLDGFSDG